jgi:hypothetical protein
VIVEARLPEDLSRSRDRGVPELMGVAEAAVAGGLDQGADMLLGEVLRTAPVEDVRLRARALVLRALVALRLGGEDAADRAAAYLDAAGQEAPGAPSQAAVDIGLELLAMLEEARAALASARASQAEARAREGQRRAEVEALEQQVRTLQRQLDELKAVHLRIESEKDEPS